MLISSKVSSKLLLRNSKDPYVRNLNLPLTAGHLNVQQKLAKAESQLFVDRIAGTKNYGRAGIGLIKSDHIPSRGSRDLNISHAVFLTNQNLENFMI